MIQIKGRVVRVLDTKTTGANDFKSRSVHVKTEEQYAQVIEIQFVQGNISLLDNVKQDDSIIIDVNLKGREWTNDKGEINVFNTIQGWKIQKVNQ